MAKDCESRNGHSEPIRQAQGRPVERSFPKQNFSKLQISPLSAFGGSVEMTQVGI